MVLLVFSYISGTTNLSRGFIIIFLYSRQHLSVQWFCNYFLIFQAPLICPVVFILFSLLLSLGPIIGNPQWGYLFAISVIVLAIILWTVFIYFKLHIPGMGKCLPQTFQMSAKMDVILSIQEVISDVIQSNLCFA